MSKKQKGIFEYLGIPGLITLLSLGFSWSALVLLIKHQPFLAISLAIIAFFLDYLDGFVARKTNKESEFGKLLDSSTDIINYLVFSALLFWLYISPNVFGIMVAFIIITTGIIRLSRFNVEGFVTKDNKLYYSGLIVCFVSLTAIVLFFLMQVNSWITSVIAIPLMILVSILQLTRIPLKKTNTYGIWLLLAFVLLVISLGFQIWT